MNLISSKFRLPCLFFLVFMALSLFGASPTIVTYEYVVTVLDEKGQPLFGVNVFTNDQQKVATTTDENGKATLKDVDNKEEINFTYIGYNNLRLPFYEIRRRNGIIRMTRSATELNEVVVIGRRDDLPSQVPYTFNQITKQDIAFHESQTTADALWNSAGVFVQKTQMGGGSPVLRGFEANRVLLVVDGVRMNNAVYRSGHLQNSITVDNAMLERTEVVFGPGSLLYGSDAMGGVIHFRSKEPKLSLGDKSHVVESGLYTRYSSANQEKSIHADVNYGKRKWATLTSLTFTDYNDQRMGSNRPEGYEEFGKRKSFVRRVGNSDQIIANIIENSDGSFTENYDVQVGTAYSQIDFTQKIKFQPNRNFHTVLNFQQSTSTDVPRYDYLTELTNPADPNSFRYAEWYYGPQRRLMASLKSRFTKANALYDKATVIGAFQRVHENRLFRVLYNSQRIFQLENVYVYSLTADFDKNLKDNDRQKLMYGVDLNYNYVQSKTGKIKIADETTNENPISRYPADNSMTTLAAYSNYQVSSADSAFTFNAGLRYTQVKLLSLYSLLDSSTTWPAEYYEPGVGSNSNDLTWSVGGSYSLPGGTVIKLLGSKAFRSPNIDDFSQFRPRNGFISIPNPDLKPERSYNGELTISHELAKSDGFGIRLVATGYYTYIEGLMTRRPYLLPDGSNIVKVFGVEYETRANINAKKGIIRGFSGEVQCNFLNHWSIESNLSYTDGRSLFQVKDPQGMVVLDTLAHLDHIPPVHGFTSLTYKTKKVKISAVVRYQGAKTPDKYGVSNISIDEDGNRVIELGGTEDNLEYSYWRIDPNNGEVLFDGTLAWATYNIYTAWTLTKQLTLNLAVENITDLHYRPFASGVSAAGRNFIVSFRVNLSK